MAFINGAWTFEDDDVAKQVARVTDMGGPLMKQAQGLGILNANKRGLANSSLAAGMAQNEVLKVAIPIGSQNAGQINQKNIAQLDANEAFKRQAAAIASNESIASLDRAQRLVEIDKQIAGTIKLADVNNIASMQRLGAELTSRETLTREQIGASMAELDKRIAADQVLQAAGDTAAMARLKEDLASRSALQDADLASRDRLAAAQIAANADLAAADRQAALDRLNLGLENDRFLQGQDQAFRSEEAALGRTYESGERLLDRQQQTDLQRADMDWRASESALGREFEGGERLLDRNQQTALAEMDRDTRFELQENDIAADRERTAVNAQLQANASYLQALAASMANENIPAGVRAAYQQSIKDATAATLGVVSDVTGMTLNWGDASTGGTSQGSATPRPVTTRPDPVLNGDGYQQPYTPEYGGGLGGLGTAIR